MGLVAESPHLLIAHARVSDTPAETPDLRRVGIKRENKESGPRKGFVQNAARGNRPVSRHAADFYGYIHVRHIKLDAFAKSRQSRRHVKNPVLSHGASSKEKAILAIHPRSSERGILAFSRKKLQMQGARVLRNEAYIEVRRNDAR